MMRLSKHGEPPAQVPRDLLGRQTLMYDTRSPARGPSVAHGGDDERSYVSTAFCCAANSRSSEPSIRDSGFAPLLAHPEGDDPSTVVAMTMASVLPRLHPSIHGLPVSCLTKLGRAQYFQKFSCCSGNRRTITGKLPTLIPQSRLTRSGATLFMHSPARTAD